MANATSQSVDTAPTHFELAPPASLELVPPAPVVAVPVEAAGGRVKLKPEAVADLDQQVRVFIDQITALDAQDPKFKEAVDRIHAMGNHDIEQSASVSNRM